MRKLRVFLADPFDGRVICWRGAGSASTRIFTVHSFGYVCYAVAGILAIVSLCYWPSGGPTSRSRRNQTAIEDLIDLLSDLFFLLTQPDGWKAALPLVLALVFAIIGILLCRP